MKWYNKSKSYLILVIFSVIINYTNSSKIRYKSFNESHIDNLREYNVLYPNTTISQISEYDYSLGECRFNENCIFPYGICLNVTTCLCMPEYANIFIEGHSTQELSCSYKRKKVVVAALLELFLPLGLGHFYVGHLNLGMIKFFYNFVLYIFCCVIYYKGTNNETFSNMVLLCVILSCIIPLWNIIDLFLFFLDKYKDGYGVSLA